ncbi:MAG: PP2C family protein-serine/threonine phosphatase, partial [Deltaproteobacteria bacterium]|nr:PP2C family protein-serine/threonine phosphatase [Deltaproteobacteria bacterium]
MSVEETSRKSSVRNNITIAFFLVIIILGIFFAIAVENVLNVALLKKGLDTPTIVSITRQFTFISTGLTIAAILFSLVVAMALSRTITKPIKMLIKGAAEVARGNLDTIIEINTEDEFGDLARDFNHMNVSLKKIMAELEETCAERERIESELNIAREIQMDILPRTFPPFPDRPEFDIYATIKTAKEVGGDLYDFFFMDDEHLCFIIGDVSGKGIPASLFMAITRTLIKSKTTKGLKPETVLKRVNEDLSMDNVSCMFVTLFLGIINSRTGELEYCNGGHDPPYILRSNGDLELLKTVSNIALGVMEDFSYQSGKISLRKGDTILLYTDGVTESMDKDENFFEDKRLEEILTKV